LREQTVKKSLECKLFGNPELLHGCRFGPQDVGSVRFASTAFGLGLGAFGHGFEDSQSRSGGSLQSLETPRICRRTAPTCRIS
jgi:hypothetical protein